MATTTNAENLRQYKSRFSLIVELIRPFDPNPNIVREVENVSLKQITSRCFTLLNILIRIVRLILSLKSKQFNQRFYPDTLYIVDMTCNFL